MRQGVRFLLLISISLFLWGCKTTSEKVSGQNPKMSSESLSERRLNQILKVQTELIDALKANPNIYTKEEQERRLEAIAQMYNSYLLDNPDDVYGYILYGKYLRQIGLEEQGNVMFMQANKRNPNLPVVKQQIANYLAEEGDYKLALPYFLSAVELGPEEMIFHYQLGEFLANYKDLFVHDGIYAEAVLDNQMLQAFRKAAELAPEVRDLQIRLAEVYYDLYNPNWEEALALWQALEADSPSSLDREIMLFNQAHVLVEMEEYMAAESCLAKIFSPGLEKSRLQLLERIKERTS